ncbi:uncharacterized protein I206_104468 [Kwoniella pini CBS 10737]|uniref:Ubiquitin-like protease family profile domain-containing protein n=1 Tax=Kwoniella pini CBS 10737 TaxID=1296096 RepID=A0AAJ8L7H6_9TREE
MPTTRPEDLHEAEAQHQRRLTRWRIQWAKEYEEEFRQVQAEVSSEHRDGHRDKDRDRDINGDGDRDGDERYKKKAKMDNRGKEYEHVKDDAKIPIEQLAPIELPPFVTGHRRDKLEESLGMILPPEDPRRRMLYEMRFTAYRFKEYLARTTEIPKALDEVDAQQVKANFDNPSFRINTRWSSINHDDFVKLVRPGGWLNDSVIDFYLALICNRADLHGKRVHYLDSHFSEKWREFGYAGVKSWTKGMDIFYLHLLLLPNNIGNVHWTCGVVDFLREKIIYFDSSGHSQAAANSFFKRIRSYLRQEYEEKRKEAWDDSAWIDVFPVGNGSDCGVWVCQTLEMVGRGRDVLREGFEFDDKNMPYLRQLMASEVGNFTITKRFWSHPVLW